ncbi:MAG: RecX family transcriptional regulator [Rubricoccaceae bacterium]|nr:RecX family transcriptional regulator [Rubricoccaceae bacterium]
MSEQEPPDESQPDLRDGTITRVAQQKRDPERVSVFIDDAFAFGLTLDLAVQEGLRRGTRLTVEEQTALLAKEQVHRARAAALDYLSYGAKTTAEVRRKLRGKGYDEAAVEDALAAMEGYGYLDDAAYARAFVRGRFAGRGYGPQRLRADLYKRGVDRALIDAALDELADAEDLGEAARRHGRRRWRTLAREEDLRKRKKKTMDFLVRRGFSYDLAREVTDELASDEGANADWVE